MASPSITAERRESIPPRVRLPRSTSRLKSPAVFCRVLQGITRGTLNQGFEGPLYPPGAWVAASEFRSPALVLECCGPFGPGIPGQPREVLWLLWKWDQENWREIARAEAVNWEWALVLKPIAERLLYPPPGLYDVLQRSREIAEEAVLTVCQKIEREAEAIRKHVWASVYDQAAGRIVEE